MSKQKIMTFGQLDFAEFYRKTIHLSTDEEKARWLDAFRRDIFLQENMKNSLAIELVEIARERHEINSVNGAKGGRPKAENKGGLKGGLREVKGGLKGGLSHKYKEEVPVEVEVEVEVERNIVVADAPVSFPFSEFWNRYPNKKGKATAEKTWKRMNEEDRRSAIDAIPAYQRSVDPRYLKHGSTYLNDKVWLDDLAPLQTKQTNGASKSFKQIDKESSNKAWDGLIASAKAELAKLPTTDELIERYRQR